MEAIILAGGFGTRLRSITGDEIPKPMVSIAGKPFLEHQIKNLKNQNIEDIILAVYHGAEKIKSYFGDGRRFGVDITYSEEEMPLGTAGAIKNAERHIHGTFFVLNGDSFSDIKFNDFLNFHKTKKSNFSIALKKINDCSSYGSVILKDDKILEFHEKKAAKEGLINGGIYLFEPEIFWQIEPRKNVSIEKETFPKLAEKKQLYGYVYDGYFIDIGNPENYHKFKKDILETIIVGDKNTIRDCMEKIKRNGIDLILVSDENKKLSGVLNTRIIDEFFLNGGKLEDKVKIAAVRDPITAKTTNSEAEISNLLLSGINHLPIIDENGRIEDVKFKIEEIKTENFPIVRGKSPLRISFAGGGTDMPHFFEKYGGAVISSTIDKYCHSTIVKRADSKIIINSDIHDEIIINSKENISYNGELDIVKAVIKKLKPNFGLDIYLHNDVPPGRGLGSSASLTTLLVKMLSQLQGTNYDDYTIAQIAHSVETDELKIKGGWQDQYAAVTGGFNFMEFNGDQKIIYPLRMKDEVINELNNHLLLCYVGKAHFSGELQKNQEKSFLMDEEEISLRLKEMKRIALETKDCLLTNNLERISQLLHESWEYKKSLDSNISNSEINGLYEIGLKNGAYGGKLLGAGGGGYLLFYYSPKKRNQLKYALEQNYGEVMDFNFEFKGIQTWNTNNRT